MCAQPQRKFHFFNCFFFKKLLSDEVSMRCDCDFGAHASFQLLLRNRFRSPGYADEAYARVRKWTAHVDLFSKDFIVLPVNQSLHWSLVIMCNMSAAERLLDERAIDVDTDVIDVRHGPVPRTR